VEGAHPALTVVLAIAVGILAQALASHSRLPSIVLLLASGAALGPDGLGWIVPQNLGTGLLTIVELAVAVILFEGGLNLEINRLRRSQQSIRRLVTWGALITMAGAAVAVRYFLGWPWLTALLFGSLVIVTGPTVVGPLVRNLHLRPRVATVLEAEGVMIDPIGVLIAVLMLELTLSPGAESIANETGSLVFRVGFGAVVGAAAGFAIAGLLRVKRLIPEGQENIFVLASVLLLSEGCNAAVSHSGLLAVTVAGIVVGNLPTSVDREMREFKDQLTSLLIGLLFILLAANVRLTDVEDLGWGGVGVVAALIFVVRPITVAFSTRGSRLAWRERAFIAWIAPRGIVAATVASATAVALEREGIDGGSELGALVFLTIAGTVVLAGLTAGPVATLLAQRLPGRDKIAILGARGLGFILGEELQAAGASVVFVDSNAANTRRGEEAGFTVIFGDGLQERTLQRARFDLVGDAVGVTPNQMLNSVFVSRARERFRVPRSYVAVDRPESGLAPELVAKRQAVVLFDGTHDVGRWEVRERHGEIDVEHWEYVGLVDRDDAAEADRPAATGELFVILMIRRGAKALIMKQDLKLEAGDVASIAIHSAESEAARSALADLGWMRTESPSSDEAADKGC
jgi:NhaP-type Na+/H+ or K+/H+ antiporter